LPQIARLAGIIIFTRLEYERSAQPEQLLQLLPLDLHDRVFCENSMKAALSKAAGLAGNNDMICIAGSLYLIGEARKVLRGAII
jgi:dihydrofolate synthase/folylpolyglutamate synthase